MMQVQVGVHVSIAGSLVQAFDRANQRECNCFQVFTKNPRGWQAKPLLPEILDAFTKQLKAYYPGTVFAHVSYLPNLAGEHADRYEKSVTAFCQELERCSLLHIPYLVTHLGHADDSPSVGRKRVIDAIDMALNTVPGNTMILLENTAGEKHSVGSTFEDIADVREKCQDKSKIGVCFDTCHAFAAGYDLRDTYTTGEVSDQFDESIGLSSLRLIHLNDAKGKLGSGLDRHEHIGLGSLGPDGIKSILKNPGFRDIPLICETPVDDRRGDIENVRMVRKLALE